jgi:hypothetical protein
MEVYGVRFRTMRPSIATRALFSMLPKSCLRSFTAGTSSPFSSAHANEHEREDEEGLTVGRLVFEQFVQQVRVCDMGKVPDSEIISFAVKLVREALDE